MSSTTQNISTFPLPRQCPFHPPAEYKEFQQQPGLAKVKMWDGQEVWIATRYDDVRAILGDNRFSTEPHRPGYPSLSPAREAVDEQHQTFLRMDPPKHDVHRRMLTREFMIKKASAWRPMIQGIMDDLIEQIQRKGPPAELVHDMFLPLTSTVIANLLDVPHKDHAFFQEQSMLRVLLNVDPSVPREASKKIMAYLDKLVTERRKNLGDDMISHLIVDQLEPGNLTHDEVVAMADLLLMAGHETTANQMALGVYSFLSNPDQLELLRNDPALLRGAIEEMLRFHSIVHYNGFRVALEDVEVAGQLIQKGEGVIATVAGANHDPAVFECPEKFDITRKADHHVAFSFGVHQCLGQPLARMELQVVFSTLFERIPNLRLAVPAEEVKSKGDHFVLGVESLPVAW